VLGILASYLYLENHLDTVMEHFECFSREANTHIQGFIPVRMYIENFLCVCWAIIFHDVCRCEFYGYL